MVLSNNCKSINTLITYVEENNILALQEYLENSSSQVDNGQTLQHYAAVHNIKIVKELLNRGADPNSVDFDNWTPLLVAAKEGKADICELLLENGAIVDHKDLGGWTALMWACYKGRTQTVSILLKHGANVKTREEHGMCPIIWAAGRGYADIVELLLNFGAKAQTVDKVIDLYIALSNSLNHLQFNSSALLWACRKGFLNCAKLLVDAGACLDTVGMNGWTPLLAATKGGYVDLVKILINHNPNLNHKDKDGMTALTLACQYGFGEMVSMLLTHGANASLANNHNDTCLILAARGGHYAIVKELLVHNTGTDAQGYNGKTALYWAAEKNYNDILVLLLKNKCDTEIVNEEGETALHRAIHNRNMTAVQMLIDAGADVSKPDKKGDSALHIAIRMRSKHLTETLLRNPRNSKLLYVPNNAGQTPYNIDAQSPHPFVPFLFGAQHLKSFDFSENMLGYDLYSSALSDVLCDPMLGLPITVGLYAKWGSGKSFLINKLQNEMISFTDHILHPTLAITPFLIIMTMLVAMVPSLFLLILSTWWLSLVVFGAILFVTLLFFGVLILANNLQWAPLVGVNNQIAVKLARLKLFFQIIYCNPSLAKKEEPFTSGGIRFLFTDYTRLTSMGGEKSLAGMLATLCEAAENEYGLLTVRCFRAFHKGKGRGHSLKMFLCVPYALISLIVALCFLSLIAFSIQYFVTEKGNQDPRLFHTLVALSCIVALAFVGNLNTWKRLICYTLQSQGNRVLKAADNLNEHKIEGFMQKLKEEVHYLEEMVQTVDLFTHRDTRLVVIIDGLDSCEQEKVLQVLDAVKILFSDSKAPFITILAIDPHIIIKAIESNLSTAFQRSAIKGYDYLRNAVNLPIFLQRQGLLQFCAGKVNHDIRYKNFYKRGPIAFGSNTVIGGPETSFGSFNASGSVRRSKFALAGASKFVSGLAMNTVGARESFTESMCSMPDKGNAMRSSSLFAISASEVVDVNKILTNDHYFSDINPRSLRRLTNIVYVSGRLMKAFSIDFQWARLASWINLIEQWPYRSSWIILYYEENENHLDNQTSLKQLYDCVMAYIPMSREIEPLLDYDKSDVKLLYMLSGSNVKLTVGDMKLFLPFSVNLDPYIKKVIREHVGDLFKAKNMGMVNIKAFDNAVMQAPISINPPGDSHLKQPLAIRGPEDGQNFYTILPDFKMHPLPPYENVRSDNSSLIPSSLFEDLDLDKSPRYLTPDEVANLLGSQETWKHNKHLDMHLSTIRENNISGLVLLTCDLDDLKKVMGMNFGDWHMFVGFVQFLRSLPSDKSAYKNKTSTKKITNDENPFMSPAKYFTRKQSTSSDHDEIGRIVDSRPITLLQDSDKMAREKNMESHSPLNDASLFNYNTQSHIEREVIEENELLNVVMSKFDEKLSDGEDDEYTEELIADDKDNNNPDPNAPSSCKPGQSFKRLKHLSLLGPKKIASGEENMPTEQTNVKEPPKFRAKGTKNISDFAISISENFPLLDYEHNRESITTLDPSDPTMDINTHNQRAPTPSAIEDDNAVVSHKPPPSPTRRSPLRLNNKTMVSLSSDNLLINTESRLRRDASFKPSTKGNGGGQSRSVTSSIKSTASKKGVASSDPLAAQQGEGERERKSFRKANKRRMQEEQLNAAYAKRDYCPSPSHKGVDNENESISSSSTSSSSSIEGSNVPLGAVSSQKMSSALDLNASHTLTTIDPSNKNVLGMGKGYSTLAEQVNTIGSHRPSVQPQAGADSSGGQNSPLEDDSNVKFVASNGSVVGRFKSVRVLNTLTEGEAVKKSHDNKPIMKWI